MRIKMPDGTYLDERSGNPIINPAKFGETLRTRPGKERMSPVLRCPVCARNLRRKAGTLKCKKCNICFRD